MEKGSIEKIIHIYLHLIRPYIICVKDPQLNSPSSSSYRAGHLVSLDPEANQKQVKATTASRNNFAAISTTNEASLYLALRKRERSLYFLRDNYRNAAGKLDVLLSAEGFRYCTVGPPRLRTWTKSTNHSHLIKGITIWVIGDSQPSRAVIICSQVNRGYC